ncbi:GTP-binding protein 10-like [Strongylocentrotus purpuratus]|uniref:GTP-binding protein 10 n=1 Tax=Strongylocentrotus purpuratus TaxID=7668 RepID=A0A7M7N8H0_STRPU|nr:GTP-binding protein 10-like [Strongylocentrotus purpuratus]
MMVFLTRFLLVSNKIKGRFQAGKNRHRFIDQVRIYARGGGGGQGHPKFGGIGGSGGDVYVQALPDETLKNVKSSKREQRYIAGPGDNSKARILQGVKGRDLIIKVPPGVCVTDDNNRLLGDLNKVGDKVLVARGGEGGKQKNEWSGAKGTKGSFKLILKLIADVGFVGFPNAGKSTLLKAVSRTEPKIADYPFTTIRPQVGIVEYGDKRQISMADLPGLIEGSHQNMGMGHRFLRHVERTKLLLFVVDVHGFQLSPRHAYRNAFETINILNKELELYKSELVEKPAILALNKLDMEGADELLQETLEAIQNNTETSHSHPDMVEGTTEENGEVRKPISFEDIIPISAKDGEGLDRLKSRVREVIDEHYEKERTVEEESEGDVGRRATTGVL